VGATPPAAPTPPANPLVGRYFLSTYLVGASMYYRTYYFANGSFAYRGRPAGGLPSCPAATAQGDDDGCIPYAYDPATGTVTIDGKSGTLAYPHELRLNGVGYLEAITPAAGTRLSTSVHNLQGSGVCGVSCSFASGAYSFSPTGTFGLVTAVSGSSPDAAFAALPPDRHGTYEVLDGGRLQLRYSDGHVITKTIGFLLDDADQPNPSYAITLDGSIYWGPASGV